MVSEGPGLVVSSTVHAYSREPVIDGVITPSMGKTRGDKILDSAYSPLVHAFDVFGCNNPGAV